MFNTLAVANWFLATALCLTSFTNNITLLISAIYYPFH
nr:MAG TPA: hypothetical protein [Caudoviricetes sp.]